MILCYELCFLISSTSNHPSLHQLVGAHSHVLILLLGHFRPRSEKIFVVEEASHQNATGKYPACPLTST